MSNNLPTKDDKLDLPKMTNLLSTDICELYSVDVKTHRVTVCYVGGEAREVYDAVMSEPIYENVISAYIKKNVYEDDQNEMRSVTKFDYILKNIEKQLYYTFHYRVNRGGEIHYCYFKSIRNKANYDSIIFAFGCEDNEVNDRRLQCLLETDALTGLYTKHAFYQQCNRMLEENPESGFDIVLMDVKNFRLLNNIYGTDKANELLKTLAKYLLDNHRNVIWGRFSGDQIIGMGATKGEQAQDCFTEFMDGFHKVSPVPNVVIKWGVYSNVDRSLPIIYMCDRAHIALKSIKNNYNQEIAYYDGEISKQHYNAQLYETCFPSAIDNKEFVVWYQPKYDPYEKKIAGAEALVRWLRAGKTVSPSEFLSVFEEDGLIRQLDEYVFQRVCEYQQRRKENGLPMIPISVNISRVSMLQPNVVERYSVIAKKCGVEPMYLPIEITESGEIKSSDIKALVIEFRNLGFPIHMDDFGSGHSSLHSLNVLPLDVLKIDKGLIDFIGEEGGEKILQHTLIMANELDLRIVAEGVESEYQLNFLMTMGCDYIQGYYFSKPLAEKEFDELLKAAECKIKKKNQNNGYKKDTLFDELKKQSRIISGMSGIFSKIYYIDLDTKRYQEVFPERNKYKRFGIPGSAEELLNKVCEQMVADETKQIMRVFNNLENMAERAKNKKILVQDYIDVMGKWYRAYIIPVEMEENGCANRVLYAVREKMGKPKLSEQLAEGNKLFESISKIYFAMYNVNLSDYSYIKLNGKESMNPLIPFKGNAYEGMSIILEKRIPPEFVEGVRRFFDFSTLRERMKEKDVISYDYKRVLSGWSRALIIAGSRDENGEVKDVIIMARMVHDEKAWELRNREEAKKNILLSVKLHRRLGAIEMAPDILQKSRIGFWAFELDEGKPPRMYVDDTMLGLLDLKEQLPPEETYHAWYAHIDKNHYKEVDVAVEEMKAGVRAEVQYPWHGLDGKIKIVRCGGVRNYSYTNGVRIEGCHQDVTELMHFQKKGATELLAAFSSDISTLYFVEPESGEYELWSHGDDYVSGILTELKKEEDFYHDSTRNNKLVVVEEDQEIIGNRINRENFMKIVETGEAQEYVVRWYINEEKKIIWIREKLIRYKDVNDSYKIVVGFEDITEKKKKEEQTKLLIQRSNTDEQTKCLNHRAFNEALDEFERNGIEEDTVFISMDVNGLKVTNDTLGHAAGDELLYGATKCMKQCFGPYGKVYRNGGDEFTAIIHINEESLEEVKEDFKKIISVWTGQIVDNVSVSCGYVTRKEFPDRTISEILDIADKRMYEDKAAYYRRNGVDRRGQRMVYDAITARYTKILKINLVDDTYQVMKMEHDEKAKEKGFSDKVSTWLQGFVESGQVYPDDIEYFLKKTDSESLKQCFKDGKNLVILNYRRKIGEEFQPVEMELLQIDKYSEEEQTIYLYVKTIDQ